MGAGRRWHVTGTDSCPVCGAPPCSVEMRETFLGPDGRWCRVCVTARTRRRSGMRLPDTASRDRRLSVDSSRERRHNVYMNTTTCTHTTFPTICPCCGYTAPEGNGWFGTDPRCMDCRQDADRLANGWTPRTRSTDGRAPQVRPGGRGGDRRTLRGVSPHGRPVAPATRGLPAAPVDRVGGRPAWNWDDTSHRGSRRPADGPRGPDATAHHVPPLLITFRY